MSSDADPGPEPAPASAARDAARASLLAAARTVAHLACSAHDHAGDAQAAADKARTLNLGHIGDGTDNEGIAGRLEIAAGKAALAACGASQAAASAASAALFTTDPAAAKVIINDRTVLASADLRRARDAARNAACWLDRSIERAVHAGKIPPPPRTCSVCTVELDHNGDCECN